MILYSKICFKELSEQDRNFNWGTHDCEKCQRRMWGHGFVSRYFAELASAVLLKRYRCPGCRSVVTTRPEGYLARVRSSVASIYTSLALRLSTGSWGASESRQRCGHWLGKFVTMVRMDFGDASDLQAVLEICYLKQLPFFS